MILIVTDRDDTHADLIIEKLKKNKELVFRLDLDVASLTKSSIIFQDNIWQIKQNNSTISSNDVKIVYARNAFVKLSLEEQEIEDINFKIWKGEWNKALLGLYFSIKKVKWLNPLREAFKAENKYLQYDVAKSLGFEMPEMIVSNVKTELLEFFGKHKKVVLKFMDQGYYKDIDSNFKGIYVNIIDKQQLSKFGGLFENPIVLQNYIEKSYEVRYTIVGNKHFVCKIESQKSNISKTDWRRYDLANTPHYPMKPPIDIKNKIRKLMKKLQLSYGALDFIVTPQNRWIFLEVNSMGQFLWIENLTNLKISDEIVSWLIKNKN